jgi:hypothetical protein
MDTTPTPSFNEIFEQCHVWRQWLIRQWNGRIPDIVEEITAAMWEQYTLGVTDRNRLFEATRTALRRTARREARHVRIVQLERAMATGPGDVYDELVEQVAASQTVRQLSVPAKAREWVRVMTEGGSASRPAMIRGRRWADRVGRELRIREAHNHAA